MTWTIDGLIHACHSVAQNKGWWNQPRTFAEQIALIHSEASEALEEFRDGHKYTEVYYVHDKDGNPKPEGIPIELADIIIRVCDTAGEYSIDLDGALRTKIEYNRTRPYRHGGKAL
jgi:NTP pyrophosphatase (non-canonical NTP hydrolase)